MKIMKVFINHLYLEMNNKEQNLKNEEFKRRLRFKTDHSIIEHRIQCEDTQKKSKLNNKIVNQSKNRNHKNPSIIENEDSTKMESHKEKEALNEIMEQLKKLK